MYEMPFSPILNLRNVVNSYMLSFRIYEVVDSVP